MSSSESDEDLSKSEYDIEDNLMSMDLQDIRQKLNEKLIHNSLCRLNRAEHR